MNECISIVPSSHFAPNLLNAKACLTRNFSRASAPARQRGLEGGVHVQQQDARAHTHSLITIITQKKKKETKLLYEKARVKTKSVSGRKEVERE